jgi:tetratricopeptide (TPR) repeat protein
VQLKYDQALSDLNKAVELEPKTAHLYFTRAFTYKNKGSKAEAISDFETFLKIAPAGDSTGRFVVGQELSKLKSQ